MKNIILNALAVTALCSLVWSSALAQTKNDAPLTNAAVIKLVRAGFKEKTVIAVIRSRPNRFDLDPDRLVELKRGGVSENIILAMLAQTDMGFYDNDDLDDEAFFERAGPRGRNSGGADIFGSNSGSRGQTKGRGMGGSNDNETTSTGSATVRILRPPAEAGGAPPKLERTPTLTNETVIKLVEAGFSEGTIIKRIEDSPAEFDLSPAKLEDLRKRRVTEAIIVAMLAAMSDESSIGSTPGPEK